MLKGESQAGFHYAASTLTGILVPQLLGRAWQRHSLRGAGVGPGVTPQEGFPHTSKWSVAREQTTHSTAGGRKAVPRSGREGRESQLRLPPPTPAGTEPCQPCQPGRETEHTRLFLSGSWATCAQPQEVLRCEMDTVSLLPSLCPVSTPLPSCGPCSLLAHFLDAHPSHGRQMHVAQGAM